MPHVEIHDPGRYCLRFDRLIDGGENDGVASYVNDDAATCQAGNDFVFARGLLCAQRGRHKACAQEA